MNDSQPWEFTCKTWGPLEANHLWHFEFKEKIEKEKDKEDDVDRWDFGKYTKDNSSSKPEDYEMFESQSNPGNDKFYVNCADCDREIEFGWSQPNRGGRIYPVECSDFLPENVWPDPKYVELWQGRGWLQKGHVIHDA